MKVKTASESLITAAVKAICDRSLTRGGFAVLSGESYRPDATAWAILALEACRMERGLTQTAGTRLTESQLSDGRVTVISNDLTSYWPTPLAMLAWRKVGGFESEISLSADFLLETTGYHAPRKEGTPMGHDTSIRGWPWIENTHSWIEPTSLSVLALNACGYGKHERVIEALKMLLDRQLPDGGWNYGNTTVFGKKLRPIPESTGHALCALDGSTEPDDVSASINYLNREAGRIRTPLALSWSIFGLTAWSNRPPQMHDWILQSLALQKKYGYYDTALLSQLIVCYFTSGNLLSLFFD
jgi:hypothetical protein